MAVRDGFYMRLFVMGCIFVAEWCTGATVCVIPLSCSVRYSYWLTLSHTLLGMDRWTNCWFITGQGGVIMHVIRDGLLCL